MRKIALIIGNEDYTHLTKLKCAEKDAIDISSKLEALGFECMCKVNVKYYEMGSIIEEFENKISEYEVGLVYFAGHGFEVEKNNFLAMIDTGINPSNGIPVKYQAYKLDDFLDVFERSDLSIKIIILDACRENCSPSTRSNGVAAFAPTFAPKGTIIAYSTSPGQKALEKDSLGNGVYTAALLRCIDLPRITIEEMFKRVRSIVSTETMNGQIPWEHTSLLGNFYFNLDVANGNSSAVYSKTALADATYIFQHESRIKQYVIDLSSHDWYIQNPAMTRLKTFDWENCSVNEIFILGRNIYQAAVGNATVAVQYLETLEDKLNSLPYDISGHLLCGMAYEIYFDSKGKLRREFKSQYFNKVVELLEKREDNFLRFIQNELQKYDSVLMYIPGSNIKYVLSLILEESDDALFLKDILCNGQSVRSNVDSEDTFYTPQKREKFEGIVEKKMVIPKQYIEFIYSEEQDKFHVPFSFDLRWYNK